MIHKERLLTARLAERDVAIEGVGTVRIRALTRAQALSVRNVELERAELERRLLSWAMVDPELSEDEARAWQEASPAGELEVVTDAIAELSGMVETAPKEAMRTFRE